MSDPELSEDDDELLVFTHVEFCKEISKNELVREIHVTQYKVSKA